MLVANGEAKATICVMDVGKRSEFRLALQELQTAIEETTGAKLPVVRSEVVTGPAIVLGQCPEARAVGLDGSRMPIEGFTIKTAENRGFVAGNDNAELRSAGTAWGVDELLERFVRVRWYWPMEHGGRSILPTKNLSVPAVWLEDAPVFRKRHIWPPAGHTWSGGGTRLQPLQTALRSADTWPVQLIVHAPRWHKFADLVSRPRRSTSTAIPHRW